MLQEPPNEGQCPKRTGSQLLGRTIAIAKRYAVILHADDAVIAQCNAEDIRGQVFERCCATPHRAAVHHPGLPPGFSWDVLVEVGLAEGGTQLGPKQDRQRLGRDQEGWIAWLA